MSIDAQVIPTVNMLAPFGAKTHMVPITLVASATAQGLQWSTVRQSSNIPFLPSGVYIDNTASGNGDAFLTITPFNYTIHVPAGQSGGYNFPAPDGNQGFSIIGSGTVKLAFVDFTIVDNNVSFTNNVPSSVSVSNTPTVNVPSTSNGLPYQVDNVPTAGNFNVLQIPAGSTTASFTNTSATQSYYLSSVDFDLEANATLAVAGTVYVSLETTDTGVFYKRSLWVPAAAQANVETGRFFTGGGIGPIIGPGHTFSVTLSSAVSGGALNINVASQVR